MADIRGYVYEVFGSFQGEGPSVGERHIFLRLCGCGLGCAYCDTATARQNIPYAAMEQGPGGPVVMVPNPMSAREAAVVVSLQDESPGFNAALSLTGGEPLEQPGFLRAVLEELSGRYRVLLETNGTLAEAYKEVRGLIDVVSMDIKLPSSSGLGPLWEEHAGFIRACRGAELVAKAVVSSDTSPDEVERAAGMLAGLAPEAVLVLQPVTGSPGCLPPAPERLLKLYRAAKSCCARVRVIPQVHKLLGVR